MDPTKSAVSNKNCVFKEQQRWEHCFKMMCVEIAVFHEDANKHIPEAEAGDEIVMAGWIMFMAVDHIFHRGWSNQNQFTNHNIADRIFWGKVSFHVMPRHFWDCWSRNAPVSFSSYLKSDMEPRHAQTLVAIQQELSKPISGLSENWVAHSMAFFCGCPCPCLAIAGKYPPVNIRKDAENPQWE